MKKVLYFIFILLALCFLSQNWLILGITLIICTIYKLIVSIHFTESDFSNIDYDVMDGHQFEHFCASVLKQNGYKRVSVTKGSGDNGVDIVAWNDNKKYVIQCKCYSSNIGNKAVQEVYTGKQMYHADIAVVMTNRYFTKSAINTARITNVILWDRDTLNRFIRKACSSYESESNTTKITNNIFSEIPEEDKKSEIIAEKIIRYNIQETSKIKQQEEDTKMYDKEKGLFPSGTYEVGDDIEIGKYLLTSKHGETGEISVYPSYTDYKEDTNLMTYNSFEGDYHLSLRENGLFIILEHAEMKRL